MFHAFFEKAAVFGRHVFCLHSGKTNIAGWKMDPDWRYFSYWTTVIFQPVMLVYQRVPCDIISQWSIPHPGCQSPPGVWHYFSRGVPIYNCPSPSIFVIVSQTPDPRCCQRPGTYTPGANWMNHGGGVIFFGTLTEKKKAPETLVALVGLIWCSDELCDFGVPSPKQLAPETLGLVFRWVCLARASFRAF